MDDKEKKSIFGKVTNYKELHVYQKAEVLVLPWIMGRFSDPKRRPKSPDSLSESQGLFDSLIIGRLWD